MARSEITVLEAQSPRSAASGVTSTIYDLADATNNHEFTHPGGLVILHVINSSGLTMNIVITAVAGDQTKQMADDYTLALPTGQQFWFPIAYGDGFVNSSGKVEIDIDQAGPSRLGVIKQTVVV